MSIYFENGLLSPTPSKVVFRKRREFYLTAKDCFECASDWYSRLKNLAAECRFGHLSDALILDKLITELDDRIIEALVNEPSLSLDKVLSSAMANELRSHILVKVEAEEEHEVTFYEDSKSFSGDFDSFSEEYLKMEPHEPVINSENGAEIDENSTTICQNERKKERRKAVERGIFKCDKCDREYQTLKRLANHMNIEHNKQKEQKEKHFECDYCHRKFISKSELPTKFPSHLNPLQCMSSNSTPHSNFQLSNYSADNLKVHIVVHCDDKPFTCHICGMGFRRASGLKTHVPTHTGEKPFACEFCGNRFTRKDKLRLHQKMHTNSRSHSCKICSKQFYHQSHVKIHMRTHVRLLLKLGIFI